MDYKTLIARSLRIEGIPAEGSASSALLVNPHSYNEDMLSPFRPLDFLHLMCGGMTEIRTPFRAEYASLDAHLLLILHEGSLQVSNLAAFSVSAGTAVLIDCNRPFSLISSGLPLRFEIYMVAGRDLSTFEVLFPMGDTLSFTWKDLPFFRYGVNSLRSLPESISLTEMLDVHSSLTSLYIGLCKERFRRNIQDSRPLPFYLKEMHSMTCNSFTRPFSLGMCEELYGISRYRLCREYSSAFGISPLQDLNLHRVRKARELLVTTDMKVHEIGSIVGFENTTHFINLFRKTYGCTPGVFRRQYRS